MDWDQDYWWKYRYTGAYTLAHTCKYISYMSIQSLQKIQI